MGSDTLTVNLLDSTFTFATGNIRDMELQSGMSIVIQIVRGEETYNIDYDVIGGSNRTLLLTGTIAALEHVFFDNE